jgi:hypothetical protein
MTALACRRGRERRGRGRGRAGTNLPGRRGRPAWPTPSYSLGPGPCTAMAAEVGGSFSGAIEANEGRWVTAAVAALLVALGPATNTAGSSVSSSARTLSIGQGRERLTTSMVRVDASSDVVPPRPPMLFSRSLECHLSHPLQVTDGQSRTGRGPPIMSVSPLRGWPHVHHL